MSDRIAGYALYIDPPLGRVGMTERQARASGRPLLIGTRPMSRVSRAVEKGETQGLMKVVADAETRQILGAAILGPGGDEAIHGILDAMNARVPYTDARVGGADPPHGVGADPDGAARPEAGAGARERVTARDRRRAKRRVRRGAALAI